MEKYRSDDIIYALATSWARSALAVIRLSGDGCVSLFAPCFSHPGILLSATNQSLLHGYVRDREGKDIDEVMLSAFRDGHGYTGEESLEISCHGSPVGIRKILSLCQALGMRQAERGEFTYRAFLHGKMDLTQAEAVEEMVESMSDRSQSDSLSRLEGKLGKRLVALRESFLHVMAKIEVQLDYSEDELDEFVFPLDDLISIRDGMRELASSHTQGKLYGSGAKVVLAGHTNVGKSSLFNALLGGDRAIVSEIPGTTRDYLEEPLVIEGIPIRLYDTAGLRDSADKVEKEGISRTKSLCADADLVVYLREGDDPPPKEDGKTLTLWSKCDVKGKRDGLSVSSVTGEGMEELRKAIAERLRDSFTLDKDYEIVVQSDRQYRLLEKAADGIDKAVEMEAEGLPLDIIASVLLDALSSLGEITGSVTSGEILDAIFSGFCVGK